MARRTKLLLVLGGMAMVPHIASANAGTPLMWAEMLHLLIGNLLIGLGEGGLLRLVYHVPERRCAGLMIMANYLSAWLGFLGLSWIASRLDWNLNNGWGLFWGFVLLTYLATVLIEWPLVFWCFPKESRGWKRSLKASWLVQSASYLFLFGWYWMASGTSIYTKMNVVGAGEIALADNVMLFYIGRDGRVHHNGELVGALVSTNRNDRLYFEPAADATNQWELWMQTAPESVRLAGGFPGRAASVEERSPGRQEIRATWFNFGAALPVGVETNGMWQLTSGFWPTSGLRVQQRQTGEGYRLAWETTFSRWPIRNVMQIPGAQAIFQLGPDQICLLDLKTKRLALIARGWGPAVLIK